MQQCLESQIHFGNPSSSHVYGQNAAILIEDARQHVAHFIHAKPDEIIWTSGATESINLALKGLAELHGHQKKHMITMQTEHKAVWILVNTNRKRALKFLS